MIWDWFTDDLDKLRTQAIARINRIEAKSEKRKKLMDEQISIMTPYIDLLEQEYDCTVLIKESEYDRIKRIGLELEIEFPVEPCLLKDRLYFIGPYGIRDIRRLQ